MTTVISVENLSKTYRLGQIGTGTFTHDLNVWWAKLRGQPNPRLKIGQADHGNRDGEELMALRDVSFTVQQGEVLGIIGRNGAGKSTLLKILSRVTAPTSGRIKVKGRIASLLEVGTGFHPELTGRENIYLNGAILGMSKQEVARKFDEIVDFAGVEKFIDTPVKRYSSGMYVRLAFAVAAHLEPEILIVDEVLAVGDVEFQKKCLGKMGEVAQGGRTVLFVSHNLPMIRQLCQRAIFLDKGRMLEIGETDLIVENYIKSSVGGDFPTAEKIQALIEALPDDPLFKFIGVSINQNERKVISLGNGQPVEVEVEFLVKKDTHGLRIWIDLLGKNDELIFRSFHDDSLSTIPTVRSGRYIAKAIIPANFLAPKSAFFHIQSTIHNVRMLCSPGIRIPIEVARTGIVNRAYVDDPIRGLIAPLIHWEVVQLG